MDHASSLAVCYAPMKCHASAVHSFGICHSLHYYWNMLHSGRRPATDSVEWLPSKHCAPLPTAGKGDPQTAAVDAERLYPGATAWVNAGTMADGTSRALAINQRYVVVLPSNGCVSKLAPTGWLHLLPSSDRPVLFACKCSGGFAVCAAHHSRVLCPLVASSLQKLF
jgi:hypothetical protein